MPRFTLRDLFWCLTLITAGLACRTVLTQMDRSDPRMAPIAVPLFFFALALIGTGIGAPFQRKKIGAVIGSLLGLFVVLFYLLHTFGTYWIRAR